MKCFFWSLLLSALLLSFSLSGAPHYTFHKLEYSELNGVNAFHWLHQDKSGYVWIATDSGLYKFDGYNIKKYAHDPGDESSLLNTANYVIFEDQNEDLWFGSGNGLNQYSNLHDSFKRYQHNSTDSKSIPGGSLLTHLVDSQNRFWISTHEGLAIYNQQEGNFERVVPFTRTLEEAGSISEVPRINVMGIHELSRDKYLLATYSNGAYIYDHQTKAIEHKALFLNNIELKQFRSSYQIDERYFLFSTKTGVVKFDLKTWNVEPFFADKISSDIVENGYPVVFQPDELGGVYIADGKLHYFDGENLTTYFREGDFDIKNASEQNLVSWVLRTQENGLLVAVDGVGLFSAHPSLSAAPLVTDTNSPTKASSLNPQVILEDSDNNIWIADGNSINVIRETSSINRSEIIASIPISNIHSFAFPESGLRFAANNSIIYKINADYSFTEILDINKAGIKSITHVDWLSRNELLISSFSGIYRFRVDGGQVVKLSAPEFKLIDLDEYNHKLVIVSPDKSKMLVSFWRDGYLTYDLKSDQVLALHRATDDNYPLSGLYVLNLKQAANDKVWLRLEEKDYALFDWRTGNIELKTAQAGPIACITGSESAYYIKQSGGELFEYQGGELKQSFGVASGVTPGLLNSDTCFLSSSNRLYLGSSSGLRTFKEPVKNIIQPEVILSEILIADELQSVINNPLIKVENENIAAVTIPYEKNLVTFRFSSSSIANPTANQYRYKLVGLDKGWRYAKNRGRSATYTNLDAGDYVLELEGSNNSGLFSTGKKIAVKVEANPWLSLWAISIYIALIVCAIVSWITVLKVTVRRQTKQIAESNLGLEAKNEELIDLNNKIQKLLKVKDTLLSHISHDFKTPLTVLMGYIEDIEESLIKSTDAKSGLKKGEMVVRQIKYIYRLVNQLMDLSRLKGAVNLERKPLDVSEALNSIIPMYDGYAKQLRVEILTSIQSKLIIEAERESFERILSNLISNAIKYNRRGGSVEISAIENDGEVRISFRDTGIGIAGNDKEVIFKQFGKVANRENLDHPVISTGLGLAIVREGVEANGGNIEVKSQLGSGSEFIVTFKLSQREVSQDGDLEELSFNIENEVLLDTSENSENDSSDEVSNVVDDNKSKKIVLVVEDTDDIANLLIDLLSTEFSVVRAVNGAQGFDMAKSIMPDVIISDIMMPVMDGFEFAKSVNSEPSTGHIPLLFLTAVGTEEAQLSGFELGAVDFIHKPFNPQVVKLKVKNFIEQNRRLAERFAQTSMIVSKQEVRAKSSRDPKFIEKLDAYIEKNLSEKITVETMASSLFMDRSAFTRKVKVITTLNTQQYILHYRLAKAYELLVNAGSVAEVADQLGFSTQNHLSTAFSKQFRITCRERMSGKNSDLSATVFTTQTS